MISHADLIPANGEGWREAAARLAPCTEEIRRLPPSEATHEALEWIGVFGERDPDARMARAERICDRAGEVARREHVVRLARRARAAAPVVSHRTRPVTRARARRPRRARRTAMRRSDGSDGPPPAPAPGGGVS